MLDSIFFFFSSRRRHTRCALVTGVQTCALPISASRCGRSCATPWLRVPGWCSFAPKNATERLRIRFMPFIAHAFDGGQAWRVMNAQEILMAHLSPLLFACALEIGRASCRERVCQYV